MMESIILTNMLMGSIQGLTEFLPISSSGHLILLHAFFGQNGVQDLAFDSFLHFASALAIVVYFWKDIWKLTLAFFQAIFSLLPNRNTTTICGVTVTEEDKQMVYALIVGTIPAVILGIFLEKIMATMFRNPLLVAGALTVGSLVMLIAERYKRLHQESSDMWDIGSWKKGLIIGLFQTLALIPGMSRSGMTISGGMFLKISRREAARFSFLLGIPLFLGAGVKQVFDVGIGSITDAVLVGVATAFVVALFVIHYLLKFLRNNTLYVFIWYRLLLAFIIVVSAFVF